MACTCDCCGQRRTRAAWSELDDVRARVTRLEAGLADRKPRQLAGTTTATGVPGCAGMPMVAGDRRATRQPASAGFSGAEVRRWPTLNFRCLTGWLGRCATCGSR